MSLKKIAISNIQFRSFVDNILALGAKGAKLTDTCSFRRNNGYAVELFLPWDADVTDIQGVRVLLVQPEQEDLDSTATENGFDDDLSAKSIKELQELAGETKIRNKEKLISLIREKPSATFVVDAIVEDTNDVTDKVDEEAVELQKDAEDASVTPEGEQASEEPLKDE